MKSTSEKRTVGSPFSPGKPSLDIRSLDLSLSGSLEAIVRLAEQLNPGTIASIVLLDEARERLRPGAAPSLPDIYNQTISGSAIGPDANPCGTAAFGNCLVVVEDIQSDPQWAKFKSFAEELGLRACWSQPIRGLAGQVLGVLAFYHPEARLPTEEQIRAIQNLAVTASNVIEKHEAQTHTDEIELRLFHASLRLNEVEQRADDERRSIVNKEAFYATIMEMMPAMLVD